MKTLLAVPLIVLGMASAIRAQDQASAPAETNANVAIDFARTSAASTRVPQSADWTIASLTAPETSLAVLSFANPTANPSPSPTLSPVYSAALAPEPSPAPQTNYTYKERDYAWDLGVGFALVRFRSSVYYASAPGFNSNLAYWFKDWLAIEGSATTGYAPEIYQNEHIKYLGYGAGPKFSLTGRSRLEPWAHAIVGGAHVLPQTALSGKNSFLVEAGGGVDYGLNPRVSARLEVDYLSTHLFGAWQNSAQGIIGIVIHF